MLVGEMDWLSEKRREPVKIPAPIALLLMPVLRVIAGLCFQVLDKS
jgi:hypothetical protein